MTNGLLSLALTIGYSDILPVQDQLANLATEAIDIIIETQNERTAGRF